MPTFLVEDGTGLANATSYVDEAYADDYLGPTWAADSVAKQNALMAGAEYADARWGATLQGMPLNQSQGLKMPRNGLYDSYGYPVTGVPNDWKKAVCLYAKETVTGSLYPSTASHGSAVKRKKTAVGPVTTEVEYFTANTNATFLSYPLADKLAKQYTKLSGSTGTVVRN